MLLSFILASFFLNIFLSFLLSFIIELHSVLYRYFPFTSNILRLYWDCWYMRNLRMFTNLIRLNSVYCLKFIVHYLNFWIGIHLCFEKLQIIGCTSVARRKIIWAYRNRRLNDSRFWINWSILFLIWSCKSEIIISKKVTTLSICYRLVSV